ncbi:uncharacterized protein LOC123214597 isoform X3 [Mangifera indica]|nr:uncharacterized protein LOC123214597 isoform X3 [Mangifera indica]
MQVKRRSRFYHLPDSVPVKYAFQGLKGTWFLHMEVRPLVASISQFIDAKCGDTLDGSNIYSSLITSTKKKSIMSNDKMKKVKDLNGTIPLAEELSRTILSSNGRRKRRKRLNNFIGCKEDKNDEGCTSRHSRSSGGNVDSITVCNRSQKRKMARTDDKSSSLQIDALAKYSVITPLKTFLFPSPTNSNFGSPRSKPLKTEVGKRLIKASKNLRKSACKKRLSISCCKIRKGKLLSPAAASVAKFLVFEISDRDY